MPTNTDIPREEIEEIKRELCIELGINPDNPPLTIGVPDTSKLIHVNPETLSMWRTSGRYGLRYTKMGRFVRYRLNDIADFVIKSTRG